MKNILQLSLCMLAISMNSFALGASDDNSKMRIGLYPQILQDFERSVFLYERVAARAGIPRDKGLAGIYHGMHVEGVKQVAQDQEALQKADQLKEPLHINKGILSLFSSCTNGVCLVEEPFEGISILAQKDLLLAMNQRGFAVTLPEGDLDKLFAKKPDESLVKKLLELNVEFPTTPEAVAVVRGALIAKHYIMQRCLKGYAESMP